MINILFRYLAVGLTIGFALIPNAYAMDCLDSLTGKNKTLDESLEVSLIGYLDELVSAGQISKEDLENVLPSWERGDLISPISERNISVDFNSQIAHDALIVKLGRVERPDLLAHWLHRKLDGLDESSTSQESVKVETEITYRKEKFVAIPSAGHKQRVLSDKEWVEQWSGGDVHYNNDVVVEFTYDFEVMDTPVTHGLWQEIIGDFYRQQMEESPWDWSNSTDKLVPDDQLFRIDDFPIAGVEPIMAMLFANRYSISKGLEPAYNIPDSIDGILKLMRDGYTKKMGDILNNSKPAEELGYRLPTNMELAFLYEQSKDRWEQIYKLQSNDPEAELGMNVLIYGKATGHKERETLSPVASHEPFYVLGQPIYDLMGNGSEVSIELHYAHSKKDGSFRRAKDFLKKDLLRLKPKIIGYGINHSGDVPWQMGRVMKHHEENGFWTYVYPFHMRGSFTHGNPGVWKYYSQKRDGLRLVRTLPKKKLIE